MEDPVRSCKILIQAVQLSASLVLLLLRQSRIVLLVPKLVLVAVPAILFLSTTRATAATLWPLRFLLPLAARSGRRGMWQLSSQVVQPVACLVQG
jgi:hypothetical protein